LSEAPARPVPAASGDPGETGGPETLWRAVVEQAPGVILVLDPDGTVRFANRGFLGRSVADLVGRPVFSLLPDDPAQQVAARLARLLEHRRPMRFEHWVAWPGHERRWLDTRLSPIVAGGSVQAIVSISLDITRRIDSETRLRGSEQRFRDIVESMGDWYWEMDAAGRLTSSSEHCLRLIGRSAAEMLGHSPVEFAAPEDLSRQRQYLADHGTPPRPIRDFVGWYLHPDGRRVCIAVSGVPVLGPGGALAGWRGVARDVTDRMQAEDERRRMEAEVHQARRVESLGVLAGGIAHDFNNLLAPIIGNTELALAELPEDSALRPLLEQVQTAGIHAAGLTRQMLAYAGRGHVVRERLEISAVIREMARLLVASVSKKVALELELAEGLPAIEADPAQLRQVVMNLVLNASEACGEEGGQVALRTGPASLPARTPDLEYGEAGPEGPRVDLVVADTGTGMSPETLGRVFDPFFTTKFTGRGLGLAAVQGIVRRQRGRVAVWSRPGEGTTFLVSFPGSGGPADAGASPPAPTAGRRENGRILLVDDEKPVRSLAARMLKALGYSVVEAGDGREALELLGAAGAPVRAVLLDLTMPRMDGREAFGEMHRLRPDLPVILCSGYDVHEEGDRLADLPFSGFLQKPFRLEELRRALQKALDPLAVAE
jgi:PAS domain S-box-containing protein